MKLILALDQGTTTSRAILFDQGGAIQAVAQREFEQHFPHSGWVEHDPEEIWSSQIGVAGEVLAKAGVGPKDIAAVGITNQRETTVIWERATGRPIHNAIVWQDRRTAEVCDRLAADGHAETVRSKTGLVIDPYFSGTKAAWILDHVDGARKRAENGELAYGTIDSWLVWNLTGGAVHITDESNAARTMLFDIHNRVWDDELLALLRVPRATLPEVRASSEVYGEAVAGLPIAGLPIAGIAGDQQAALFGQLCLDRGLAKNTYGTGCFLLTSTGEEAMTSSNNLLTTIAWRYRDTTHYALEGSVFVGGAVVQWLRDGLGIIKSAPEVEPLARSVEDNGGIYLVPAFTGLGAPHWDPYARGTLCGITRATTAGHIARAALEAIAFQVADLADAMSADAGFAFEQLRADGGAAANDLLMQFQADILGTPVERPVVTETTALGAAYLAGLAVGVWSDVGALSQQRAVDRLFEPAMSADRVAELRGRWNEAVKRSIHWENHA